MSNVEITGANSGSRARRPAYLLSGYNVQRGQRTDSSLQSQKLELFKNTMLTRLEFGSLGPGSGTPTVTFS
jgi:hypothetical protein